MKPSSVMLLLLWSAIGLGDEVVPVHEEPFHRPLTDTSTYRVLDVSIPPGETTLFHTHAEPTLYVTLQRTTVRAQRLDGEWGEPAAGDWAPGDVRYDGAAVAVPFSHRVENLGDDDFRLTLITNNRRTPNSYPDLLAAMPGEPGLDNEFFAQSRIYLEPGELYRFEGAKYSLILVLVSGSQVTVFSTYPDVIPSPSLRNPGDIIGANAGAGSLLNEGTQSATIIAVAIR